MSNEFIVWSNRRLGWWKARGGYTTLTHLARRYSRAEIDKLVDSNKLCAPGDMPMLAPPSAVAQEQFEIEAAGEPSPIDVSKLRELFIGRVKK